jgi:hypothetical protein
MIPFAAIGYEDRIRIQRVGYDPNPSGKTRLGLSDCGRG